MENWKSWRFKNLTIFPLSILFAVFLSKNESFHSFLMHLGNLGYLGAFFTGIFFVSTFTVSSAVVVLFVLAESLTAWEIGIIAGLGAVVGDLTIFRLFKDHLLSEIEPIYDCLGGNHVTKILHLKYFSWTLPVLGALVIASPFPDELGISLIGISKMKTYQFLVLSFVLNAVGIFLVVSASAFIKL